MTKQGKPDRGTESSPAVVVELDSWTLACRSAGRRVDVRVQSHPAPIGGDRRNRRTQHSHAARRALSHLLSPCLELARSQLVVREGGAPALRPADGDRFHAEVSLAHCAGFAAAALAQPTGTALALPGELAVGIDVETPGARNWRGMAPLMLHPGEAPRLAHLPSEAATHELLKLWCCKEALLKALGVGIADLQWLGQIAFDSDGRLAVLPAALGDIAGWQGQVHSLSHGAALAVVWR